MLTVFRLISLPVVSLFLPLFIATLASAEPAIRYGIWAEAEGKNRPFNSAEGFKTYLDFIEKGKFTDIYCQVYRGGRSWYPSMVADDTPYRDALKQGFDPLKDTIKEAHARGQKVHAWINMLRVTRNFEAPLLKTIGREAVLVDNYGNNLLDYNDEGRPPGQVGKYVSLGTPGIWLDASNPRVRQYIIATVEDVLHAYPELDGVHLDMVRYPFLLGGRPTAKLPEGVDLGYSRRAISAYLRSENEPMIRYMNLKMDAGVPGRMSSDAKAKLSEDKKGENGVQLRELKEGTLPSGDEWDSWRRSNVTMLVFEIKALMNRLAPEKELSAAVIAWPDRAYYHAFQDWRGWLVGGMLDTAVPMNYNKKDRQAFYLSQQAAGFTSSGEVLIGLGAWMKLNNHDSLVRQSESAIAAGNNGVVLFSYSNLLSDNGREIVRKVGESVLRTR